MPAQPARRIIKSVSMEIELAEWIEQQAEAENRSVNNLIETLLIRKREEQQQEAAQSAQPQETPTTAPIAA